MQMQDERTYRSGVGLTIFNNKGFVFVAERIDNPGAWQMPQGGIDDGEDIAIAAFREMEEEIGTRDARILSILDDWIYYDIPERTAKKLWGGKYKGQRQKWIALEFTGMDSDIVLDAFDHPEFRNWKWVELSELLEYAAPFKRNVYERVINEFRPLALKLARGQPV